jgi:hypothetical protein
MNHRARPFLVGVVLALSWLGSSSGSARADDVTAQVLPIGTHAFRRMLHEVFHLKPVKTIKALDEAPQKTLLIVFGNLRCLRTMEEKVQGGLKGFLDRGGAVLVASDRGTSTEVLDKNFHIVPDGAIVTHPDPRFGYGGQTNYPLVKDVDANHPLFEGVGTLATNTPTFLGGRNTTYPPLAWFPQGSQTNRGRPWRGPVFAAGNRGTSGKVLLLGGHGVFMNATMASPDQPPLVGQNFKFAVNCIRWFTKSPKRDRVLMIQEGQIIDTFQVKLKELPEPPITLEDINQFLRGVQEENLLNLALLSQVDPHGERDRYWSARNLLNRWAVVVLAGGLALYGLYRLWRARHRPDLTVPLVAQNVTHTVSTASVLSQRQKDMLAEGNFWEAARGLARQCFADYAARSVHFPPPAPHISVRAGRWPGRTLAKQVERLWDLAFASSPRRISRAQFARLSREADNVRAALASGRLLLEGPAPTPRRPAARRARATVENG